MLSKFSIDQTITPMRKLFTHHSPYPRFMHYHPEEMGFGGPDVWSEWNEMGWIMEFIPQKTYPGRETNIDILRFLAMRRAGYPVLYRPYD